MKRFLLITLGLIMVMLTSETAMAQNLSYKQQRKIERKALKIHQRLGIDQKRVVELLQMDKEEEKKNIEYLTNLNISNDSIMMEFSTEDILRMKTDCKFYGNRAARKRNRIFLYGAGGFVFGLVGLGIGGPKCIDSTPLVIGGALVYLAGFSTIIWQYIKLDNDPSNEFYAIDRLLIVENKYRPMDIGLGDNTRLQAGVSIMKDSNNKYSFGPSIAIKF